MLDVPLYSSRITRLYVGYVKQRYPDVDTDAVLAEAGLDPEVVFDPGSWLTQNQVDAFHGSLRRATANPGVARAAGRHSVYAAAGSAVRQFILGLLSPDTVYGRIGSTAVKLSRGAEATSRRLGRRRWELVFTPRPGVEEKPYQCENRRGFIESVTEFFGYGFAHVEHPRCWHRGDEACEYIASWSAGRAEQWRLGRNIAFAGALVAVVALPWVLPAPWAAAGSLAALLVAAVIAHHVVSLQAASLARTVRRQGSVASEIMEEAGARYDAAMLLLHVGRVATEHPGRAELLGAAGEAMAQRLSFERAALYTVDDGGRSLSLAASYGWPEDEAPPGHVPVGAEHLAARVARAPGPVLEVGRAPGDRHRFGEPIIGEESVFAVIVAETLRGAEPPTRGERASVQALASQVALGLERLRADEQLARTSRLEALGTLAGGVAHDFNNLLTGILGNATLVRADLRDDHPHAELLDEIAAHARSGADLTGQLLGVARRGKVEVRAVDLLSVAHRTVAMFGRTRRQLQIEVVGQGPVAVLGDPSQLEQVLLNLLLNADQAMPLGGRVEVQVERARDGGGDPGVACLAVTDTGRGMDEETVARIFDPFFTTHDLGHGTGLGLSSAHGIVENHGGEITVRSALGEGTTFEVRLPLADVEVPEAEVSSSAPPRGCARVLLVDDEAAVRRVGRRALERLGYEVDVAEGGQQALEAYAPGSYDLVLLDLIMPGMTGAQTYDHLREKDPGVKVLLSSGYSVDDEAAEVLARGADGFLQKPFGLDRLALKVEEVLRSR